MDVGIVFQRQSSRQVDMHFDVDPRACIEGNIEGYRYNPNPYLLKACMHYTSMAIETGPHVLVLSIEYWCWRHLHETSDHNQSLDRRLIGKHMTLNLEACDQSLGPDHSPLSVTKRRVFRHEGQRRMFTSAVVSTKGVIFVQHHYTTTNPRLLPNGGPSIPRGSIGENRKSLARARLHNRMRQAIHIRPVESWNMDGTSTFDHCRWNIRIVAWQVRNCRVDSGVVAYNLELFGEYPKTGKTSPRGFCEFAVNV